MYKCLFLSSDVAQWVARLTCNVEVVGSSPIKGPRCFLEQETTLIAQYWLVSGTDSSVISQSNLNELRALWKIGLNVKCAPLLNIVKTKKQQRQCLFVSALFYVFFLKQLELYHQFLLKTHVLLVYKTPVVKLVKLKIVK